MRIPTALLSFVAPLAAQTLVTVPNGYENLEGTSAARTPFGWTSGRVQYLVDGAQLCPNGALITSLRLRLDGGNFNVDAPVAKTFTATIEAYEVPVTPATMSATFTAMAKAVCPQNGHRLRCSRHSFRNCWTICGSTGQRSWGFRWAA